MINKSKPKKPDNYLLLIRCLILFFFVVNIIIAIIFIAAAVDGKLTSDKLFSPMMIKVFMPLIILIHLLYRYRLAKKIRFCIDDLKQTQEQIVDEIKKAEPAEKKKLLRNIARSDPFLLKKIADEAGQFRLKKPWIYDFPNKGIIIPVNKIIAGRITNKSNYLCLIGIFGFALGFVHFLVSSDFNFLVFSISSLVLFCPLGIFLDRHNRLISIILNSTLEMTHFPAFCGESFSAELYADINGKIKNMQLLLQCFHVTNRNTREDKKCIYEHHQVITTPFIVDKNTPPMPVQFDIPAKCLGTELYAQKQYIWSLTISAETPQEKYNVTFQIPIYRKQRVRKRQLLLQTKTV